MTNDKIYASIVEMLRCYERETGRDDGTLDNLLSDTARLHELALFDACPNIYASAARVLVDLRDKMDKKANSAGRVNVCRRMDKGSLRAELAGIHEHGGRYCITDGYRAFRFSADLPSIRRAQVPFDFEKVISYLSNLFCQNNRSFYSYRFFCCYPTYSGSGFCSDFCSDRS